MPTTSDGRRHFKGSGARFRCNFSEKKFDAVREEKP
jgi:hypothetical protein